MLQKANNYPRMFLSRQDEHNYVHYILMASIVIITKHHTKQNTGGLYEPENVRKFSNVVKTYQQIPLQLHVV